VIAARPDVFNHNTETVPRLYKLARHGGRYDRTLGVFRHVRAVAPTMTTKSGIIVGLGETRDELIETMRDLRSVDVQILTLGQYLRPSAQHLPVAKYYHPDEFADLADVGRSVGFTHVESGPLVRSSYHAKKQTESATRAVEMCASGPSPSAAAPPTADGRNVPRIGATPHLQSPHPHSDATADLR